MRAAQRAGRHALAPGADVRDVDAAARDVIDGRRLRRAVPATVSGTAWAWRSTRLRCWATSSDGRLADRTPVTVEPGIYLPGRGGVRIEDTLVVRDGGPELLTTTPKDLLVL